MKFAYIYVYSIQTEMKIQFQSCILQQVNGWENSHSATLSPFKKNCGFKKFLEELRGILEKKKGFAVVFV